MSSDMGAISVTNLSKAYKQYKDRFSRLKEWILPGYIAHHKKWILQDVTFSISAGECVGVIGVNGAGKSTLLKMITGTTQPTTGQINISGRVVALLELGMGFHPDFTGRQNLIMAGQLQGLSVEEIDALTPEIEAFADIGEYIDREVRIYSSGMQARLAFAVATCVRPDILIVDEALSVGDMAFQAKCMQRMTDLASSGVTILFVSHALNQVRQFCEKALYISNGVMKSFGPVDKVCDEYQNDLVDIRSLNVHDGKEVLRNYDSQQHYSILPDPDLRKHSVGGSAGGSLELEFMWFNISNANNELIESCRQGDLIIVRACIRANCNVPENACVGLLIADLSGYHLFACNANYYDRYLPKMAQGECVIVEWKFNMPLALGELRIDSGIKPEAFSSIFYDRIFCAKFLTVIPDSELLKKNFGGYLFVDANVVISKILQN